MHYFYTNMDGFHRINGLRNSAMLILCKLLRVTAAQIIIYHSVNFKLLHNGPLLIKGYYLSKPYDQ